ncbi:MAG: GNAT family N-acetyltransferase [Elusimicrobiota bacterium]
MVVLYKAAGWWKRGDTPALLRRIVAGSHCYMLAVESGRLVGMGRALSDRANDAYIQDVFVTPERRGRGIASALVRRLERRLRSDGLRWVGLIAADRSRPFYEKLGFRRMKDADPMLKER